MSQDKNLFEIIKQMTKNEKRFFKLYTNLHNHSRTPYYVDLFDIFEKMEEFNETALRNKIKKTFPTKNISQLKNYLKENIFASLKSFHRKNKEWVNNYEDFTIAKTLILKGFFLDAEKILLRLKEQALAMEHSSFLIMLNHELHILKARQNQRGIESIKSRIEYCKESIKYTQIHQQKLELDNIMLKIMLIKYSDDKLTTSLNKQLRDILDNELSLFNVNSLLSKHIKIKFYNIKSVIHVALNEQEAYFENLLEMKALLESSKKDDFLEAKLILHTNISIQYVKMKDHENFSSTLSELAMLLEKHPRYKTKYTYWLHLRNLEFYTEYPNEKPNSNIDKNILKDINNKSIAMSNSNKIGLLLALARYYFTIENYTKCQYFLLQITLQQKVSSDDYYFLEIYLLEILCYYELREYNIAKNKLLSFKRRLIKEQYTGFDLPSLLNVINRFIASNKSESAFKKNLNQLNNLITNNITSSNHIYDRLLKFLQKWVLKKQKRV